MPEDHDLLIKISTDVEWIKKNYATQCATQEKRMVLCEKRFKVVEEDVDDLKSSRDKQRGALTFVEIAVGSGVVFSIIAILLSIGVI